MLSFLYVVVVSSSIYSLDDVPNWTYFVATIFKHVTVFSRQYGMNKSPGAFANGLIAIFWLWPKQLVKPSARQPGKYTWFNNGLCALRDLVYRLKVIGKCNLIALWQCNSQSSSRQNCSKRPLGCKSGRR